MTDLGTLGGTNTSALESEPFDINENGHVVGWARTPDVCCHAFLWQDGGMTDLGTLGGDRSRARIINELDQVIGDAWRTDGTCCDSFLWQDDVMTDLGTFRAHDLNDAGQLVGTAPSGVELHAALWEAGSIVDLGTLGGAWSRATDINENGQIAGVSETATGASHGFLWTDGIMTDLGTLGGDRSIPTAINEAGQVAGWSDTSEGDRHAFLWENGVMTDLGTLGGAESVARDINETGQVIGSSDTGEGSADGIGGGTAWHAFVWEAGLMKDLGTLGGCCSDGSAVNDAGQVVGSSVTAEGVRHATLWRSLVPEELEDLIAMVSELETQGVLNKGQANSLRNKLNVATAILNDGKTTPAINQLEAFINQVESLVTEGVLTSQQGEVLIDKAHAAIESMSA